MQNCMQMLTYRVSSGILNVKEGLTMSTRTTTSHKPNKPNKPVKPPVPAHPLVAVVRAKLGLPRKIFSRLTGFSERVIANWESGQTMSQPGLRRVLEIERLRDVLARVMKPEIIPQWLDTPNKAFDGLKPLEVIERGEVDRLWKMLFYLEAGVAS
jgi:DNA-binding transcriptional regulator YiaG